MSDNTSKTDMQALQDFLLDIECLDSLSEWTKNVNFFEIMKITHTEIRHSNMLAWLLDPNEYHGMGDCILRGFINCAITNSTDLSSSSLDLLLMDLSTVEIKREWEHIDLIAIVKPTESSKGLVLCIENKIDAKEHNKQLNKYATTISDLFKENEYYFINIYLTKTGIPAENEEDQQKWLTMSYEDVLTIIEQQSRRCNLSGRSSMIIEDYIETLRRHIVDNNDLHEKCVEIYRKHKQALDLIYEHKPDQLYVLYEYISEWAKLKHNQGQIVFVPEKSNKTYIRFKTNKLSQILPDSSYGKSGWNSNNFYFYEVYNYIDNEGKNNFRIQLEFSFTDSIPTELRKKCEMLNRIVTPNSKPIKQWRVVFHGKTKKYDSENGELDKALVWKDLDEQFDSIIKKETELIEKWNGM